MGYRKEGFCLDTNFIILFSAFGLVVSLIALVSYYNDKKKLDAMKKYNHKISKLLKPVEFLTMQNDGDNPCDIELEVEYMNYFDNSAIFLKKDFRK